MCQQPFVQPPQLPSTRTLADIYTNVRTFLLVQNVPEGTLQRFLLLMFRGLQLLLIRVIELRVCHVFAAANAEVVYVG